jgi:predicted lipid-binding transport protein (Tim44 family)
VQYFDIILLALLAAFVLYRLGRVLGRRPDDSGSRMFRRSGRDDNVVSLPGRIPRGAPQPRPIAKKAADAPQEQGAEHGDLGDDEALAAAGVAEIRMQDASFDVQDFLAGAKAAYEMVVTAFAKGDRDTLKRLLTRDVEENFSRAITEREQRGETLETTIVGVRSADVTDARMAGRIAEVTVKFVSDIINVVRRAKADPEAFEGAPPVKEVIDIWTFVRDVRSSDPNWALAETHSPT